MVVVRLKRKRGRGKRERERERERERDVQMHTDIQKQEWGILLPLSNRNGLFNNFKS